MFDKILTINLNPSLDTTLWVDRLDADEPVKANREVVYPGGKAINLSRVLTALGAPNKCVGFIGNENGRRLYQLLESEKISCDFIEVNGAIRENLSIVLADKKLYKINRNGFAIEKEQIEMLTQKIEEEILGCKNALLMFAGSLPQKVTSQQYKSLILHFCRSETKVAIDTDMLSLDDLKEIKPFLIKPNKVELDHLAKREMESFDEIKAFSNELSKYAENVLISLGADGLFYENQSLCPKGIYCKSPHVEVRSTVGAGDTTLAGFVYALSQENSIESCVEFSTACGTAAVLIEGTGVITKTAAVEMLGKIVRT